jgi:3-hydroxyacyl-[acyl-carrier-protein] dehydratase
MDAVVLNLGPDVIAELLPHRRPFVLVDRIVDYTGGDKPTLTAQRYISANEPIFEGHFPGLHLWPGAYTVEGLGQTGNLLQMVHALRGFYERDGKGGDAFFAALRNMELGFTMGAGFKPEVSRGLLEMLHSPDFPPRAGLFAAVNVKLLAPVFAGQRLDYTVTQTHVLDGTFRWEVEASVNGQLAAKGTMTATSNIPIPVR